MIFFGHSSILKTYDTIEYHKKDIVLFAAGTSWGLLGFTRGLNSYD